MLQRGVELAHHCQHLSITSAQTHVCRHHNQCLPQEVLQIYLKSLPTLLKSRLVCVCVCRYFFLIYNFHPQPSPDLASWNHSSWWQQLGSGGSSCPSCPYPINGQVLLILSPKPQLYLRLPSYLLWTTLETSKLISALDPYSHPKPFSELYQALSFSNRCDCVTPLL